ncbi:hypothetical protein [Leptolyngbya sp. 'hensonii']|uniref:hypothetical protein n=1 Tax=Leptolyngbya sp. 'hensonii' TaxID=1922337 RepID=UPI000AAE8ACC|nr:hypothetical protein [Leptolyngbya sp. 'hensonii']
MDSAIAPRMVNATGVAKFLRHIVIDTIGNGAIDGSQASAVPGLGDDRLCPARLPSGGLRGKGWEAEIVPQMVASLSR